MSIPNDGGFRVERDSMGEMRVPANALYGASTARAVENFPVSSLRLQRSFLRALGLIKLSAARVNEDLELLAPDKAELIETVAREVANGQWDGEFPIDVFQT
ncbi:MAG: aspartate ammonia-lyase, partial [Anaerolineae bacterium]|nr:aspartate ammonia-lyase [Anaerolineae bacterium]